MTGNPSLLGAGGAVLGAAAAAAALIRGERIGFGQKALIAVVLLCAPGFIRRARTPVTPVLVPAEELLPETLPASGTADHLRRDIALRPVGPDGHMAPARFRIVGGHLQPFILLQNGAWAAVPVPRPETAVLKDAAPTL